jgi:MoxR-like ATPase
MTPLAPPSPAELQAAAARLGLLRDTLNNVLFGQQQLIEHVITGILASGHILLEGLPGLGKTELVKGLAAACGLEAKRIQFTPDLMPADITGTDIIQEDPATGRRELVFVKGPIFANILLADEINRTPPKTQAALLEAMEELQVTVQGKTYTMDRPFFVLATQNPIELEGTYPLPEAQLDRFMFKLEVLRNDVPVLEKIIRLREIGVSPDVRPCLIPGELLELMVLARRIHLSEPVINYTARLCEATHPGNGPLSDNIRFGASPRAALALAAAAKARALLHQRPNASIEDIQALALPVLRHRLILTYDARLAGKTSVDIITELIATLPTETAKLPKTLADAKI